MISRVKESYTYVRISILKWRIVSKTLEGKGDGYFDTREHVTIPILSFFFIH